MFHHKLSNLSNDFLGKGTFEERDDSMKSNLILGEQDNIQTGLPMLSVKNAVSWYALQRHGNIRKL